MKVGLYDLRDQNNHKLVVNQVYQEILKYNKIESIQLRIEDCGFWDKVRNISLFIMRFQHYDTSKQLARDILPLVENELGIPCFPNQATAWQYDDKVKQYYLMEIHGFPMTKSWIFYNRAKALEWARTAEYPVVFKLRAGAGSMNVILVDSPGYAQKLINRIFGRGILPQRFYTPGLVRFTHFKPHQEVRHILGNLKRRIRGLDPHHFWLPHGQYVLFQQYLPGNTFDTRIVTIGERAFGYRRKVRPTDFRSSGSGLNDYDKNQIDKRCVEIAHKVSKAMSFQTMAYDFLINEEGDPEFCEISYNYGWKIRNCLGYWDREMNWHEGNYWPEYLHLADGLKMPDLKMPRLDY